MLKYPSTVRTPSGSQISSSTLSSTSGCTITVAYRGNRPRHRRILMRSPTLTTRTNTAWRSDSTPKTPASDPSGDAEEDADDDEPVGISAADLQFGNDFDHPIRDRLPPGFGTAMNIVRWWIDPGLEGDAYADMPYLYGPALSSFNAVHVGSVAHDPERGGIWVEERR